MERTATDISWQKEWLHYTKDAPPPPATGTDYHLWGYFRLVQIKSNTGEPKQVLLFKAQAHLAYDPFLTGLTAMTNAVLTDTGATILYSIGTAGGVSDADLLGNTMVTNSAYLKMTNPNNGGSPLNNKNYSNSFFPSFSLIGSLEKNLLFPLASVTGTSIYENLFKELGTKIYNDGDPLAIMDGITVTDLVNAPLDPANLKQAAIINCQDKPLLTTDFYYIAQPGDAANYCILEMDDAVLGAAAAAKNVAFVFVRNVSDPVVPGTTLSGKEIPDKVRNEWSSLIYDTFGFYTSYNGALCTWATIAGN
jgi:hypothetical protein